MNKNLPLVTVVIPSYNHEKYIEEAVNSIIKQTYQNIEFIVIDDGSSDNSPKILTDLSNKYDFKYIHRPNKGLIRTLNEALDLATGIYFTMLGSDDYYSPKKIDIQIKFFQKNPQKVLCYANTISINSNGDIGKEGKTKHFRSGFVFDNLLYQCFIPLPTVMVKTDILREFRFDERFFLEDYPLWLKITQKYQIGYIKEALTYYRMHDTNVSSDMIKMIKEVERILADYKEYKTYPKVISKWYLRWFADLSKTTNLDVTYEYMKKASPTSFYKVRFIKAFLRYSIKKRNLAS